MRLLWPVIGDTFLVLRDRTLQSQASNFGEWRKGDFACHVSGAPMDARINLMSSFAARVNRGELDTADALQQHGCDDGRSVTA